ncbi:uncharacterized protein CLUP02_15595 [Colletotrichum lupini]|uniref:Uncharacterized protein n=1 Tax=Colletotrichum lupini TaxID=145971 RepID=A0A9Q8T6C5_9PEZI|nr:uncharacterized protein CLUP02_15595 [Colletotrichum lupini]UQC90064.1 hypothetical protein CLUP02_15595 [Colletotrichum lupini]
MPAITIDNCWLKTKNEDLEGKSDTPSVAATTLCAATAVCAVFVPHACRSLNWVFLGAIAYLFDMKVQFGRGEGHDRAASVHTSKVMYGNQERKRIRRSKGGKQVLTWSNGKTNAHIGYQIWN